MCQRHLDGVAKCCDVSKNLYGVTKCFDVSKNLDGVTKCCVVVCMKNDQNSVIHGLGCSICTEYDINVIIILKGC